jgi:hypothetical protein
MEQEFVNYVVLSLIIIALMAMIIWADYKITKTLRGRSRDKCQVCHGVKDGEPGNENIVNGVVMCDYCHADYIKGGITRK